MGSPGTYRWSFWDETPPEELGGFNIYGASLSGSIFCSFPVDPTQHRHLLSRVHALMSQRYPVRIVLFSHSGCSLPNFETFRLPNNFPDFQIYLLQNTTGKTCLPISFERFSSNFTCKVPNNLPLFPPMPTPKEYLQRLNRLSEYFWLPEIGLRCIAP